MFELAHSDSDSAGCIENFVAVRQKVLIVLWTFYKLPEQVPSLFNKFQPELVNKQLQGRVTPNHLLENLTFGRNGQKEVGNIQPCLTQVVCCHTLQYIGNCYTFTDAGQQCGFLSP